MISMALHGAAELEKQLLALGALQAQKTIIKAVRKALKPVLEEIIARAPVDSGLLRDSFRIAIKKDAEGNSVVAAGIRVVRAKGATRVSKKAKRWLSKSTQNSIKRQSAHWRWHFIELGTKKKAARPFIRPAFDRHAEQMVEVVKKELQAELKRIVKRNRKAAILAEAQRAARGT